VTDNGALDIGDVTSGAILTLDDGTTVTGGGTGTLTINAGNTLDIEAGPNSTSLVNGGTLDGVAVTDNGALDIGDVTSGAILTLDDGTTVTGGGSGTLTINAGNTLDIEAGPNASGLVNGATLDGVSVTDSGTLQVDGSILIPTAILMLDDGTTISGGGKLSIGGHGELDIEVGAVQGGNSGFGSPDATLDGVTVTNDGAIDVDLNASGAILALDDGTTITGGVLSIGGSGILEITYGSNGVGATLDGAQVGNVGAIQVGTTSVGDATLTLDDGTTIAGGTLSIGSGDTLDIEAGPNSTSLVNGGTLDGIAVTDNGALDIGDLTSGAILTLDDGTTVTGGGTGTLTINAHNTLDIEAGPNASGLVNGGTLDGVAVTDNGALDIGDVTSGAILTLDDGTTVTGGGTGTLTINAHNTLDIEMGPSGPGGANGPGPDATLDGVTVTNHGAIDVGLAASGAILALDDDTAITGGTLTIGSNGTLKIVFGSNDFGATLDDVQVSNSGTIEVGTPTVFYDPTLTLDGGTVVSNGTLTIASGDTLVLDGATITGTAMTISGLIDVTGAATIDGSASLNGGNITIESGQTLTLGDATQGAITISGTTISFDGTGDTLDLDQSGSFTANGFAHGDTIDLAGVDPANVSIGNSGTLQILYDGNAISLSGGYDPASFSVASDGHGGTVITDLTPTVTINVLTSSGLDFKTDNPLKEMGAGTVQSGGTSTSFTILDAADHREFVIDGNDFTYGDGGTITGGTITSFHESTDDSNPVPLADFTGLSVAAVVWLAAVQQDAAGNHSAIDALTGTFSYNFIGGSGPDTFGAAGQADTLSGSGADVFDGGGAPSGSHDTETGGAGSTFVFGAGYGALTITNFDQGVTPGVFDPTEGDKIQLNNLAGPLNVNYANGNAILDFGNGDVLTLLGVTQSEFNTLNGSEFSNGSGGLPPAVEYLDWQGEINPLAATQASPTQWIVPDSDGLTSTVFTGTGFTYDPTSHLPTGGTISSVSLVDNLDNSVLQTITGVTASLGAFGSFISQAESIQGQVIWSGLIEENNGPLSVSSTDIRFANSDGTFTDFIGSGFSVSHQQLAGTVATVERVDAQGDILNAVNLDTSLGNVGAALFTDQASQQFYDLAAEGNTNLTWYQGQVGTSILDYPSLNDAPGNHIFTGSLYGGSVDFADATSGVTVNLGTGTASWGGYQDTLTNISGVTGSKFADTITGDNNNDYIDGYGAPSGSHDTLTGGTGADTFVFAQGYGAATITNFDQGTGTFNPDQGDLIQLNNFSSAPTVTYVPDGNGVDTVLTFGTGDVLTLLGVTQAEFTALNGFEFISNGGASSNGPEINAAPIQLPAGTPDGHGGYVPVVSSNAFGFSDPNTTDVHTVTASFDGNASSLGALDAPIGEFSATLGQDTTGGNPGLVNWSFTLDSSDLLLLDNAGALPNVDEVYDVNISNGYGGTITQQVSIEISGTSLPGTVDVIGGASGPLSFTPASSELFQLQAATISASTGDGLSVQSTDGTSSDDIVVETDPASSISVSNGYDGIDLNSGSANAVVLNAAPSIVATGTGSVGIYAFANGNVAVNDLSNTYVSGDKDGIAAYSENNGTGNVAVNVYANATVDSSASYGILAFDNDSGNISVTTSSADLIVSGGAGVDAVNEDSSIPAGANSTITVNTAGTIDSGSNETTSTTPHPPAGILAGYLGGSGDPASYPLSSLNGTVVVNNAADIYAAAGDGIRAYNYGDGNITVNDTAAMIQAIDSSGQPAVDGFGDGISANNFGTGSTYVTTAAGTEIQSNSSGIFAFDGGPTAPDTGVVSVVAHGIIDSGSTPTASGSPAAGILAGYEYDPTSINNPPADSNDLGNVSIDDFASITAAAGTDGIRGFNYGTGEVTITVESGVTIDAPVSGPGLRYGIDAFGQGGDVSVTNDGSITGGSYAVHATTTGSGTASVENYGDLTGDVLTSSGSTITNETGATWSVDGSNPLGGSSSLTNDGIIDGNGTSSISGLSSLINNGTIEVQTGSLALGSSSGISGTGGFKIDAGTTLEIASGAASTQSFTFEGTTGVLKLESAQNFHGVIYDFGTADGTQANSDWIDLSNINFSSANFHESFANDFLTVTDGTNTAQIQFSGTVGSLNFVSDGTPIPGVNGSDGTLIYDPPVPAAPVIASGGALEIANSVASAETVTFQASTGSLTLDNPSSFHGTIAGFTGDGTLAGSDQIDLKGIDYQSSSFADSFNAATDTLSVSEGADSATLHFTGIYQAANFSFTSDGTGGTIVYDPPVPAGPAPGNSAVAAQTSHGFVFNFANAGHDASIDLHWATDVQHPTAANLSTAWAETHDVGPGTAPEGFDPTSQAAIIKAQLHSHDFHFA